MSFGGVAGQKRGVELSEDDEDVVSVMPLGAAKEVGRSCIILKHKVRRTHIDLVGFPLNTEAVMTSSLTVSTDQL